MISIDLNELLDVHSAFEGGILPCFLEYGVDCSRMVI
ncbi:hypothetical protein Pan153_05000 [Gimesia panareensis]|uniref:Uncharacterized protein n=1 Tax=Gimesia panareensis TaxID=2527978 RepID=A0A518FHR2_9PLAN|nr:hypothetical protein Pan153_05000 [Gimesia panareensis]